MNRARRVSHASRIHLDRNLVLAVNVHDNPGEPSHMIIVAVGSAIIRRHFSLDYFHMIARFYCHKPYCTWQDAPHGAHMGPQTVNSGQAMFKRLMQKFDRMVGRGVIDDELYEELEEALIEADTNIHTASEILASLRKAVRDEKITDPEAMRERLKKEIANRFRADGDFSLARSPEGPTVYLFVGVNGVGKTTSIAKLAQRLIEQGHTVLLAAGDTFRAAAIEQLETWAKRVGADIVKNQPGGDSASVIFDAVVAAKSRGVDFVLADTAGRQHSKEDLMKELTKVTRVIEKARGRTADEVLLVLDANTGQNALRQAEMFLGASGVTGLILTKLDGTARGGALIGVFEKFKVPVKLIGVGEKASDLRDFDPGDFAQRLFD